MISNKAYQELNISQYSEAILFCSNKKTCTNLAKSLDISNDKVYRQLDKSTKSSDSVRSRLKCMVDKHLSKEPRYLIFDDTLLVKQHAQKIEGLEISFDGSSKRVAPGLRMVTALLTDGYTRIPIDVDSHVSKSLAKSHYKSKGKVAMKITENLIEKGLEINMTIADAHFSTKEMVNFFNQKQINYLMKIPCNRIVTIGKTTQQLKKTLRLKRNARVKSAKGFFKDVKCYFYVIKVKDGLPVYFISSNQIDPYEVANLYRIRWNIEIFHRTAKQHLGLNDCQSRSIERQLQHALLVMQAFSIADVVRSKLNLGCTEEAIRRFRNVKFKSGIGSMHAIGENLC